MDSFVKDPDGKNRYTQNWAPRLADWDDDTIASATWSITVAPDADLTIIGQSNTTTTTTVRVAGGTKGKSYVLTCHVVLASGDEDDWSIKIKMKDK